MGQSRGRASRGPLVPVERIARSILVIRGEKVILDADIAAFYGVETGALNRAVKRNIDRFPLDFMFQLTKEEFENLRCQTGASSPWGGRRYPPYAFTEQGVAMLSSVLPRSKRAIQINIAIMRTFVYIRQALNTNKALAKKVAALEQKYDAQFGAVFKTLGKLMAAPESKKGKIGFRSPGKK